MKIEQLIKKLNIKKYTTTAILSSNDSISKYVESEFKNSILITSIPKDNTDLLVNDMTKLIKDLKESKSITILGCGTSYHAGLIGKYVIESLVKKRVNVYLASEFSNVTLLEEDTVYLFLSQSGETIDLKLAYNLIKDNNISLNTVEKHIINQMNQYIYNKMDRKPLIVVSIKKVR